MGAVFAGLLLALTLVWSQRYALIEKAARYVLKQQNIAAEVTVSSLNHKSAHFEAIRLSQDGRMFFSADNIYANYDWHGIRNITLTYLSIEKPYLTAQIDEKGGLVFPNQTSGANSGENPFEFPKGGVNISNGQINLESPFGNIAAQIGAKINSPSDITANIHLAPTQVKSGGLNAEISGPIEVKTKDGLIYVDLDITASQLNTPALQAQHMSLAGKAVIAAQSPAEQNPYEIDTINVTANFENLSVPDIHIAQGSVKFDGTANLTPKDWVASTARGAWSVDLADAGISSQALSEQLARKLSLHDILSELSISAPFAPPLTRGAQSLLSHSDILAGGGLIHSPEYSAITLTSPAKISSQHNQLVITPRGQTPIAELSRPDGKLELSFDADLSGHYALRLQNAKLSALATDDQILSNIQTVSARLITEKTWRATPTSGHKSRIAPMDAQVEYTGGETRKVTITGGVDVDGDLPGGYGEGFKAKGRLNIFLEPQNRLRVFFTPSAKHPVTLKRFELLSGFYIENTAFTLKPEGPVYIRSPHQQQLQAKLENISGHLQRSGTDNINPDMDFHIQNAQASAQLTDNEQQWGIKAASAHLTLDTFPAPEINMGADMGKDTGAEITSDALDIDFTLTPGAPISFNARSAASAITTNLVSVTDMTVTASGSPHDLSAAFGPGPVNFASEQLPTLLLKGRADFDGRKWSGHAETHLPQAQNTPVNIKFAYEDGAGTADANITDLAFAPGQLQPQQLVPVLSGKISRVKGAISSHIHLSFGQDQPLRSSGTVNLKDMSFGTLPGPVSGLNSDIHFASLFPVQTDGVQFISLENFDPGYPLSSGEIAFEIMPDGLKIHKTRWPIGDGYIALDPTKWEFGAPRNEVTLRVENVSLGEVLKNSVGDKFYATGIINGTLPVIVEGLNVTVDQGRLAVDNGGIIQFQSAQTNQAGDASEYAGLAFEALKNFEYESLEAKVNGPLNGNIVLSMIFTGHNEDVLGGADFKFNTSLEGNLLNIARSLKVSQNLNIAILQELKTEQLSIEIADK